jgi:hypothetical protein
LLVEGDTGEIFYEQVKNTFLSDCRITIRNLRGLYNINAKRIDQIIQYVQRHNDEVIRIYCCLDRESRYGEIPGFDIKKIKKCFSDETIKNVLGIDLIRATQQIESWFFYDIEGIYKFLRTPKSQRNLRAFKPPEKFGYRDLQKLFEKHGKTYNKGKKAAFFINKLNIGRIVSNCKELKDGITLIQSQASDLKNQLYPAKKLKSS